MAEGGEKTEEATPKKLDDARRQGSVWKSRNLSGVMAFATAMGVIKATWDNVELEIRQLFTFGIDAAAHPETLELAMKQSLYLALTSLLLLCIPVALGAAVMGSLMDFLQVGPLLATKALMPKLDKLNPINGLKNLFGKKQLVELLKSMFKLSVSGYVVYGVVRDAMGLVVATIRGNADMTMTVMEKLVYRVVVRITLLFTAFAIFDVWWQRRTYMKDQMMSKDEVKREYKESEGDPHHKAHRRQMHQEIIEGAQMESVRKADVVVTNPEHVAVALVYDKDKDVAPRVVAKGVDERAAAIRAIAKEADVPMFRNVPLAHALLRVEVGLTIPEELYDAVAEVLNFVYQLQAAQAVAQSRPGGVER